MSININVQKQPPEVFYEKRCSFENIAKFTGNITCDRASFFKVARLRPDTLLKKELWHRCLSLNLLNFQEHFFTEQPQVNVSEEKHVML